MAAFSIRWHGLLRIHSKSSQPGPRAWRSAASADNAPNTALSSAFSSPPNDGHSLGSASEASATCRPASRPPPALRPLLLLRAAVSWLTAAAHARSCRLLAMSELPAARPGQRGGRRGSMRRMHPDPGPQRRPGQRPGAMLRLVAVCCAAADQRVRGRGQPRSAALSASHERVWERQRARRNELQTAARVRRLEQWAAPGCAAPRRRSTAQQRAQTEHALPVGVRCVPAPPPRLELCWAAAGGGAQPAVWWTPGGGWGPPPPPPSLAAGVLLQPTVALSPALPLLKPAPAPAPAPAPQQQPVERPPPACSWPCGASSAAWRRQGRSTCGRQGAWSNHTRHAAVRHAGTAAEHSSRAAGTCLQLVEKLDYTQSAQPAPRSALLCSRRRPHTRRCALYPTLSPATPPGAAAAAAARSRPPLSAALKRRHPTRPAPATTRSEGPHFVLLLVGLVPWAHVVAHAVLQAVARRHESQLLNKEA